MPQALADILAQLSPVYDPQKQVVNQQLAALPGQQQAEQQGLDQAKTNAFSSITEGANSRGMVYSGMPIAEQAKYTGATFLPAVANLKSTYANKGFQLQGTLAQLEADKMKQAQGVYGDQVKAEQDAAAKQYAAQLAAQSRLQAAQIAASSRVGRAAADPAKGYQRVSGSSGLAYRDAHGNPITAGAYYNAKGATGLDAIKQDLMGSQNEGDQRIAADIGKLSQAELLKKYPWVFGG